jgi:hypothetical protein
MTAEENGSVVRPWLTSSAATDLWSDWLLRKRFRSTSRSQKEHTMKKEIPKNTREPQITRRQMVGSALAAAGVITGAPTFLRALNLHNKLNIAMIA